MRRSMEDVSMKKQDLLYYCKDNERVCPLPPHWYQLQLRFLQTEIDGKSVPNALILGGWHADDEAKRMRLAEHINWAEKIGKLSQVDKFLRNLREEDWYHTGE